MLDDTELLSWRAHAGLADEASCRYESGPGS
jgi:hypothetical protein